MSEHVFGRIARWSERWRAHLAAAFFVGFAVTVVGATAVLAPGWGLMDDPVNLEMARSFWEGSPGPAALADLVADEMRTVGRFRPLYAAWRVTAYALFADAPWLLRALVAALLASALLLWGSVIRLLWPAGRGRAPAFDRFALPLAVVVFTPFLNLFLHLSLQETAMVVLAGAALYGLARAYRSGRAVLLVPALSAAAAAVASKETGLALLAALLAFAVLDLWIYRRRPRLSWIVAAVTALLAVGETAVVMSIWHGSYSSRYSDGLDISTVLGRLAGMPPPVLAIAAAAAVLLVAAVTPRGRSSGLFPPLWTVFPSFVVAYVVLLAPWGYVSYMLAPLAPFALVTGYPVLVAVTRAAPRLGFAVRALAAVLVVVATAAVLLPRIAREADIRAGVDAAAGLAPEPGAVLVVAPPFSETATSLALLSGAEVAFLDDGVAEGASFGAGGPIVLFLEYRSTGVRLRGLAVAGEILANRYWRIVRLRRDPGSSRVVGGTRTPGLAQRIVDAVKR